MHQLLVKYLENKCNAHELSQVLAYLKTDQGQQHLAKVLDQEINEDNIINEHREVNADYDQIFERIKTSVQEETSDSTLKSIPLYKRWYSVAAVISGFILMATAIRFFVLSPDTTTYQTTFGETKSIVLPDSSLVTLNANSSLVVQNDFDEQREVWLEGEAFFEVEKTKSRDEKEYIKFTVHTGRLQVEVLGTSFNVQEWEEKTQVVLKSGKVKLKSSSNEMLTMEPGDLAEVSGNNDTIRRKVVNPDIYSSWTENKLLCHDTPLEEIATLIERRYGKKVVFQEENLERLVVAGTLPLHKLSLLTEVLQESLKINIQAYEEKLVISKLKEKPAQ